MTGIDEFWLLLICITRISGSQLPSKYCAWKPQAKVQISVVYRLDKRITFLSTPVFGLCEYELVQEPFWGYRLVVTLWENW